jgi:hypothetical protein
MKGNNMDPILTTAAALIALTTLGPHQPDGFRDTGCDPAHQIAVTSERTGEVLYWNNPTCPAGSGATDGVAASAPVAVDPEPENGDDDNGNGADSGNESGKDRAGRGNRSGLGDGTNPGRGAGRDRSPNEGTNNPGRGRP